MSELTIYIIIQVYLLYDMQYKFQTKVLLPKNTREVHFITSVNIFLVALIQFGLSLIWTRVRSQLVRISEILQ